MASPTPIIGRTRPEGSQGFFAAGAIAVNRIVLPNGVDSSGRPRCKQADASGVAASPVIPAGVSQNAAAAAGDQVEVANGHGVFLRIEAGAALAADADFTYDNVGRAVAAAPTSGNNAIVCGRTLQAAGAAGDVITTFWSPTFKQGQ